MSTFDWTKILAVNETLRFDQLALFDKKSGGHRLARAVAYQLRAMGVIDHVQFGKSGAQMFDRCRVLEAHSAKQKRTPAWSPDEQADCLHSRDLFDIALSADEDMLVMILRQAAHRRVREYHLFGNYLHGIE